LMRFAARGFPARGKRKCTAVILAIPKELDAICGAGISGPREKEVHGGYTGNSEGA
jgi:hypothetical protein